MFVARIPRFVQETLAPLVGKLSGPQRRHLQAVLAALLLGTVPKLRHLAARSAPSRHRTSLAKFLSRSEWDEAGLLNAQVQRTLRRLRLHQGESIDLILDDTRLLKRARKMADVSTLWDHSRKQFARGHYLVLAAVAVRGLVLPYGLRVWHPQKNSGYRKLTELAADLVREFPVKRGVRVRVLFDAAYLSPALTRACEARGFTWYSLAVKTRRFWRERQQRFQQLRDFGPGVLKHRGQRVRLPRSCGWRWMRIAAESGWLSKIGPAQVVFAKRPREPWKKLLAIVTNDLKAKPRDVVARYERRWQIEVLFKELRELGLGAYQMQHRTGIQRHLHLVCLAHLLLTHHALQAVGAQATQPRIPVPQFRQRCTDLRRQFYDQQTDAFTQRIKHPKTRQRVREFLKMAA